MKREDENRSTATTAVREAIKEIEKKKAKAKSVLTLGRMNDHIFSSFPFFLFLSCTVAAEQQKMVVGTGKLVRSYLLFFCYFILFYFLFIYEPSN